MLNGIYVQILRNQLEYYGDIALVYLSRYVSLRLLSSNTDSETYCRVEAKPTSSCRLRALGEMSLYANTVLKSVHLLNFNAEREGAYVKLPIGTDIPYTDSLLRSYNCSLICKVIQHLV